MTRTWVRKRWIEFFEFLKFIVQSTSKIKKKPMSWDMQLDENEKKKKRTYTNTNIIDDNGTTTEKIEIKLCCVPVGAMVIVTVERSDYFIGISIMPDSIPFFLSFYFSFFLPPSPPPPLLPLLLLFILFRSFLFVIHPLPLFVFVPLSCIWSYEQWTLNTQRARCGHKQFTIKVFSFCLRWLVAIPQSTTKYHIH